MRRDRWKGARYLVLAGLCSAPACLVAGRAQAPQPVPACPPVRDAEGNLVPNLKCTPATPTAPAADRFPYPGEPATAPSAPAANSPAAPQTPASEPADKRFPYPGEPAGSQTVPASGKSPLQDAGSSGQSSSSSSSSSNSSDSQGGGAADPNDPDTNDPAAIPRRDRHKLPPGPRQTPSEREIEDVQVAGFYFNDGNFRGSYDRAKDAVSLDSEDAAAQLALGNAARRLGKLDEAERAYRLCLDLDPVPKIRKPAEKALHEMTGQ